MHPGPYEIPTCSDAHLKELVDRIRPMVRKSDGSIWWIKVPKLRTVAFPWDPIYTEPAPKLVEVGRCQTLHTWAYYGFFKPTVAEVLCQLPLTVREVAQGFEVVGPDTADDLNREKGALDAGFHVATTIFYKIA